VCVVGGFAKQRIERLLSLIVSKWACVSAVRDTHLNYEPTKDIE
jgi:hypothetical protein